ncbi:MAG: hypothetical protein ACYDA4_15215 [Ignavibacteriaceae bacterium]
MWLIINEKLNDEEKLLSIGKALILCQKFESTCKYFIMMMSLAKKVTIDMEFEFMSEEHQSYVDKLLKFLLGNSIEYYQKNFKDIVDKEGINCLIEGKKSRNFICHESAIEFIYSSIYSEQTYHWDIVKFKEHISNVAIADYFVSRWTYEFQEGESGYFVNKDDYVDKIKNWIFIKNEV